MAYYAIGERGSEGHARDQLANPSMHWVTAVQKSHPNAMVSMDLCWVAQPAFFFNQRSRHMQATSAT